MVAQNSQKAKKNVNINCYGLIVAGQEFVFTPRMMILSQQKIFSHHFIINNQYYLGAVPSPTVASRNHTSV